jgi:hypothetical protein
MRKSCSARRLGLLTGALLAAVVFLAPLPAVAHHGWGGYLNEEFEITGTAETSVSVAGAHASMKLRVDGNVWDVVMAPPARTQAAGLKSGMIPVGAKVTVHGHRHRDPNRHEVKTERVTWEGREYAVYPDRD